MSLAGSLLRVGARAASLPLRGVDAVVDVGVAVERRTRAGLGTAAERVVLGTVDAVLASNAIDVVLERIETAGVAQHVAQRLLDDGIAEQAVTGMLQSAELEQIVINAVDSEHTRETLSRVLESEAVERLFEQLLNNPGGERLVDQSLRSPLLREAVARLLESEELWILVDEIAHSPSVTEAITSQSASFVGQVTDRVRLGSRDADALVERTARRIGRRRKRDDAPAGANVLAGDGEILRPTTRPGTEE